MQDSGKKIKQNSSTLSWIKKQRNMECNIKDFESVLVIDGKTHGIAKIEPLTSSFKFFTTAMYNDGEDVRARTFKLTKEDATTFLQNYGHKTIYIGIRYDGYDKLLNGFTI